MPQSRATQITYSTPITVIARGDCPVCHRLLKDLQPLAESRLIDLRVVNLADDNPPPFAQGFIVPATYLGKKLWRYGRFSGESLLERLAGEK